MASKHRAYVGADCRAAAAASEARHHPSLTAFRWICSLRLRSILLVDLLSPLLRSFLPFSVARITAASLQAWVSTEVTTVPHDILIVLMVGQHDALEIYTEIPSTTEMMDIIIQIMDEVANLSLTSVAIPRIERTSLYSWDCDKGGQAKPSDFLYGYGNVD